MPNATTGGGSIGGSSGGFSGGGGRDDGGVPALNSCRTPPAGSLFGLPNEEEQKMCATSERLVVSAGPQHAGARAGLAGRRVCAYAKTAAVHCTHSIPEPFKQRKMGVSLSKDRRSSLYPQPINQ